jgi:hypothetical protein
MKRSAMPWIVVAGTLFSFSYAVTTPKVESNRGPVTDTEVTILRFAMGMGGTLAIAGAFWIGLGAGKPEE